MLQDALADAGYPGAGAGGLQRRPGLAGACRRRRLLRPPRARGRPPDLRRRRRGGPPAAARLRGGGRGDSGGAAGAGTRARPAPDRRRRRHRDGPGSRRAGRPARRPRSRRRRHRRRGRPARPHPGRPGRTGPAGTGPRLRHPLARRDAAGPRTACCGRSWACDGPTPWRSARSRAWTRGTTRATRIPPSPGPGPGWRCCRCWRRSSARGWPSRWPGRRRSCSSTPTTSRMWPTTPLPACGTQSG